VRARRWTRGTGLRRAPAGPTPHPSLTPPTSRALLALLGLLALLFASGCSPPASPSSAAPDSELTLEHARRIFTTFVTADDVARAARDEPLQLSLVNQAQLPLTVSAYERADYSGAPATRYSYGVPQLYVPQLRSFPLWFVAVARRGPSDGGPTRTAIMVFSRPEPPDTWQLTVSTLLQPGMSLPRIALDRAGHATALATFDHRLLISPNSVGAVHAAVANDGPAAPAAAMVAPGPFTTGLREQIVTGKRQITQPGLRYDSALGGTAFPLYALATADGGGLVLYSLNRGTVILRRTSDHRPIPVPPSFAPILYATGHLLVRSELDTGATFQYAAYVPARQVKGGKMEVIGSQGGPTSAGGQ